MYICLFKEHSVIRMKRSLWMWICLAFIFLNLLSYAYKNMKTSEAVTVSFKQFQNSTGLYIMHRNSLLCWVTQLILKLGNFLLPNEIFWFTFFHNLEIYSFTFYFCFYVISILELQNDDDFYMLHIYMRYCTNHQLNKLHLKSIRNVLKS